MPARRKCGLQRGGATIDPDMYQIYYSGNIVGLPGSSESNHYHIQGC